MREYNAMTRDEIVVRAIEKVMRMGREQLIGIMQSLSPRRSQSEYVDFDFLMIRRLSDIKNVIGEKDFDRNFTLKSCGLEKSIKKRNLSYSSPGRNRIAWEIERYELKTNGEIK